jgi:hypothetical protein
MGVEFMIFAGIAAIILLRAVANAGASSGNANDQVVTNAGRTFVPFPNAGNGSTNQAGGASNPKATNGNGQNLGDPTAQAINEAASAALLQENYSNSNGSSTTTPAAIFTWADLTTGVTSWQPTYWRAAQTSLVVFDIGNATTAGYVWRAPMAYSGPTPMVNCPQPSSPPTVASLQAGSAISW